MKITDEAVQAALEAANEHHVFYDDGGDQPMCRCDCGYALAVTDVHEAILAMNKHTIRTVLEAALPHIRQQIADELWADISLPLSASKKASTNYLAHKTSKKVAFGNEEAL